MVKECQGRDFESVRIPLCMAIHWCWGTVRFSMDLDSVRSPQYFSFGRFLRVILFGALPEQFVWSCRLYTSLRFFEHVQPWQSTFQHFDPKCMGSTYTTSDLLWLVTKCHQMSPNVTKCHQMSPNVTKCHQMSPNVTKCHQMSPRQQQRDLAARLVSASFPGSGWASRWAKFFWFPVRSVRRHPAGNQKPLLGGQSEGLRANIFLALPDSLYLCSDWINTMIKQDSTQRMHAVAWFSLESVRDVITKLYTFV